MNMKYILFWFAIVVLFIGEVGCSSKYESPYRDPGEMRGRTTDFTTYDVQQCVIALVDDLLSNEELGRRLAAQFPYRKPLVAIRLENLTYQHSATDKLKISMFNTIESRLLNSGRFDFRDRSAEKILVGDTLDEKDSVLVDDATSAEWKDAKGVDYLLMGNLLEFREGDGRIHDTYYKMTMKLQNKRTKNIDWSAEKEIRKVSTRAIVGW